MSVTKAKGFIAGGISCGIKESGAPDLALVAATGGSIPTAAVFTTNKATAAPVQVSRKHLEITHGMARGVILNSGCANAATGADGLEAARLTCQKIALALGATTQEMLVCSTGLIGTKLPLENIISAIDELVLSAGSSENDAKHAAEAILTTDTHAKQVEIEGTGFTVGGMAKGAGMIAPNMATMLVVLTTDAKLTPEQLSVVLKAGVEDSFNELIVDGCTSTNDTVMLFASGEAGEVDLAEFEDAVKSACADLAYQLAEDAEGTTRVALITVAGATSVADAKRAGRQVALSLLVKTSLYGADPYWGRVVSELGASGAEFDLDRVSIAYGGVVVCRDGVEIEHDSALVAQYMKLSRVEVTCNLGLGEASATITTTDLGHGYIDENMRTS
jgi:glutamate N-acetyltransferase/amino-acid N-acetyltransferase